LTEDVDINLQADVINALVKNIGIKKLNASFTADPVSAVVRAGYPLKKQPQNQEIRTPLMPSTTSTLSHNYNHTLQIH
jgi:hypothetical protein